MRRIARYIYVGGAWLALASVLVTILMAGVALFVRDVSWDIHREFGWSSGFPLVILILAGVAGWIPRRLVAWLIALALLHTVQTALPTVRRELPLIAAVHPLNATLLAWLSLVHAKKAAQLLLKDKPAPAAESSQESQVQA